MPEELHALTAAEVLILKEMRAKLRNLPGNTVNRPQGGNVDEYHQAPETYVAKIPAGGIPALSVALGLPGSAVCTIWRIDQDGGDLEASFAGDKTVWNLTTSAIDGGTFIPITKDKFGAWLAGVGAGGGIVPVPARITGRNVLLKSYSWVELCQVLGGEYDDKPGGLVGTDRCRPAFERNGNLQVPVGARVWLWLRSSLLCHTGTGSSLAFTGTGTCATADEYEFVCPDTSGIVRLTSDVPGLNGLFEGWLQNYDSLTDTWSDGELVWVKEAV